jgi:branched-chain amino acid transport system substrate-binding protein
LGGDVLSPDGNVVTTLPSIVEEAGMELVYTETWPGEGFSDWLTLANSLRRANAEMLFAATASAEEVIQLTRAMQTVGYQPRFVYFSQGTQPEYIEGVGEATEGVLIHSGWSVEANWVGILGTTEFNNSDFVEAYREAYGTEPDEDVSIPFALCQAISQAVEAVGSTDNQAIKEWLHARTAEEPVRTILGDFHFDERGLPIDRTFLAVQWQGGELRIVYPVDEFEGTADLIYPKPEW